MYDSRICCPVFVYVAHLGVRLEEFVRKFPKLKLIRVRKHAGLIQARMTGANAASGEVIVFLDSHCEATKGDIYIYIYIYIYVKARFDNRRTDGRTVPYNTILLHPM